MRSFKPNLRGSIYAILSLGHPSVPPDDAEFSVEDIRSAMLELMKAVEETRFPQVFRRVRYAGDVQGLWYLRGDVMAALASSLGEVAARVLDDHGQAAQPPAPAHVRHLGEDRRGQDALDVVPPPEPCVQPVEDQCERAAQKQTEETAEQ